MGRSAVVGCVCVGLRFECESEHDFVVGLCRGAHCDVRRLSLCEAVEAAQGGGVYADGGRGRRRHVLSGRGVFVNEKRASQKQVSGTADPEPSPSMRPMTVLFCSVPPWCSPPRFIMRIYILFGQNESEILAERRRA